MHMPGCLFHTIRARPETMTVDYLAQGSTGFAQATNPNVSDACGKRDKQQIVNVRGPTTLRCLAAIE